MTPGQRCTKPSTQVHGGGYIEVCCMCDEHANASPREWNWRRISQDEGALTTAVGIQRDRRRCQFVELPRVTRALDVGSVPNGVAEFDGRDAPTITVTAAPTATTITIPDPPPPEMLDRRGVLAPVHCHRDTVDVTTANLRYAGEWMCIVCGARLVQPFKHDPAPDRPAS